MIREIQQLPVEAGKSMDLYVSRAERSEPIPGVIVIHDILGLNRDTERISNRLATWPMYAVAPDLYQGLGPKPICVVRTIRSLKRREGVTFDRLSKVQEWLQHQPEVDPNRIVVIGFCMGGGFALLHSVRHEVTVAAPFYGDVPESAELLDGICPVVGGYGGRDKIFAPQGERLKRHLDSLGVDHDVVIYPEAGHSYMNRLEGLLAELSKHSPMRAAYDPVVAEHSWARMMRFFEKYLTVETDGSAEV